MAKKISQLSDAAALTDADLAELEQPGETAGTRSRKVTLALLRAYALRSPENVQTDNYTLVLSDAFKLVTINAASAKNLTVPPNSSVAFPVGTRIDVGQDGAGQVTIVADDGVTIRTPETLKLRKQWAKATLIKRGTDTWDLEGNLEAAP